MKYLIVCLILLSHLVMSSSVKQNTDDLNLAEMIQPVDSTYFVRDSVYFHWCHSIVKDAENHYCLLYARWPKNLGFYAWLTHSEIAIAESSDLFGPYTNGKVIFKPRPDKWDAVTVHNVQVRKFNNLYYLYYISTNTGNRIVTDQDLDSVGRIGYSHPLWGVLRGNQRPGVAVSDNLLGDWKRFDKPIVEPAGPIKNVAVNPSVCKGPDGKYHIIVKGDDANSNVWKLIQAYGISANPEGPFVLNSNAAFSEISSEDIYLWYDKDRSRYYAVFHSHGGSFIGLITSEDGVNWQKAKYYKVCDKEIPMKDGTVLSVDRMERPSVYFENNQPKALSFSVKKGNDSFIVIFPLLKR